MVTWHKFDYEDENSAVPLPYETVWIVEEFYANGVTQGYHDGYTFNTFDSKDDCKVSYWAYISYPDPPEEWVSGSMNEECEHCPDGHDSPGTKSWAVFVSEDRDSGGQPTHLYVAPADGSHVSESDAQWLRDLIKKRH